MLFTNLSTFKNIFYPLLCKSGKFLFKFFLIGLPAMQFVGSLLVIPFNNNSVILFRKVIRDLRKICIIS